MIKGTLQGTQHLYFLKNFNNRIKKRYQKLEISTKNFDRVFVCFIYNVYLSALSAIQWHAINVMNYFHVYVTFQSKKRLVAKGNARRSILSNSQITRHASNTWRKSMNWNRRDKL